MKEKRRVGVLPLPRRTDMALRYAAVKSVSITWIWIHSGVVSEYADLRPVRPEEAAASG